MHDVEKKLSDAAYGNAAGELWLERLTHRIRRERELLAAESEHARIASVPQFIVAQRGH